MYFKPLPTQLELMEKLYYCQTTKQCYVKGQTQNPTPTLYAFIFIDGQQYAMNRIVWTYHFGLIPDGHVIDHADRNKLNNDINNLFPRPFLDNNQNVWYDTQLEDISLYEQFCNKKGYTGSKIMEMKLKAVTKN